MASTSQNASDPISKALGVNTNASLFSSLAPSSQPHVLNQNVYTRTNFSLWNPAPTAHSLAPASFMPRTSHSYVFDILPPSMQANYVLPATTAVPPLGRHLSVVWGINVFGRRSLPATSPPYPTRSFMRGATGFKHCRHRNTLQRCPSCAAIQNA